MQEFVARGKMHGLYHWLGSWRRVAYWWLTGKSKTSGWSQSATHYVNNVMAIYERTTIAKSASTRDVRRYSERSSPIDIRGKWSRAEHRSYRGDAVRQAKRKGQTATFRFIGSQVAWNAPKGPTRGKAKVYIDGQYVKTVDLLRASLRRAQPDLHEGFRPIRRARPDDLGCRDEGPAGRCDRRVPGLGLMRR